MAYDPKFISDDLDIPMPLVHHPQLQDELLLRAQMRDFTYSDHTHFSLVMNRDTKQLIYSACNVEQKDEAITGGSKGWTMDEAVGAANQIGNEFYADMLTSYDAKVENPYDKGHMVMRSNTMFGDDPDAAGKATYIYANALSSTKTLNRSEWRALEMDIVGGLELTSNRCLCVFTGPIWGPLDKMVVGNDSRGIARVPSGFFKVICFRLAEPIDGDDLGVLTFAVFQDRHVVSQQKNGDVIKTDQRYQITITELELLTGLRFDDKIRDRNPLIFQETTKDKHKLDIRVPEHRPIGSKRDLILSLTENRMGPEPLEDRRVAIVSAMVRPHQPEARNEYVTFLNRTGDEIDLEGWVLRDQKEREVVLSGVIPPASAFPVGGEGLRPIRLLNSGGSLILTDQEGRIVDSVSWNKEAIEQVPRGKTYQFEVGQ